MTAGLVRQIPLNFHRLGVAGFDNYLGEANREALAALRATPGGGPAAVIYLWGPTDSGKTHLLQAACNALTASMRQACYLPLARAADIEPSVCEGLEALDLVCLDDLDAVAGDLAWEQALFHLYNRLHGAGRWLLMAARTPPRESPLRLADLRSRLGWELVYQLRPLDDAGKRAVLAQRAAARGLAVSDDILDYLFRHSRRDLSSLCRLIEELDLESLAAQRRLTLPFVRQLLAGTGSTP